jgi:hypothetical protein
MVGFGVHLPKMHWKKATIYAKISAVELTAIQMVMQHKSRQEAERNLLLTDSLAACWMLRRVLEGDSTAKWMSAHVGIRTADGSPT